MTVISLIPRNIQSAFTRLALIQLQIKLSEVLTLLLLIHSFLVTTQVKRALKAIKECAVGTGLFWPSLDSRNHGLHRCHWAGIAGSSTLPTTAVLWLQADEAEILAASAMHMLTSFRVLNQRAAKYACSVGGASLNSTNFLPGALP